MNVFYLRKEIIIDLIQQISYFLLIDRYISLDFYKNFSSKRRVYRWRMSQRKSTIFSGNNTMVFKERDDSIIASMYAVLGKSERALLNSIWNKNFRLAKWCQYNDFQLNTFFDPIIPLLMIFWHRVIYSKSVDNLMRIWTYRLFTEIHHILLY